MFLDLIKRKNPPLPLRRMELKRTPNRLRSGNYHSITYNLKGAFPLRMLKYYKKIYKLYKSNVIIQRANPTNKSNTHQIK